MLFSNIERSEKRSLREGESYFPYLNKSARSYAHNVRSVLENWYAHYPDEGKEELRKRLSMSTNYGFISAFFELYLHELLLCLSCKLEIHPNMPNATSKHPEFLATCGNLESFYVEAISLGISREEEGKQARMNAVYDAINKLDSPDYIIGMTIHGSPRTSPSSKKLCEKLTEWLHSLNYDEAILLYEQGGIDSLPPYNYNHDGWNIDFFLIPKMSDARGRPGDRPVGVKLYGMQSVRTDEQIFNALKGKASRYKELDKPYVIAVNVISQHLIHVHKRNVLKALLGDGQGTLVKNSNELEAVSPNGFWWGVNGKQHTRVSAVLIADGFDPSEIADRDLCLYHNPWAKMPYQCALTQLSEATPDPATGKFSFKNGRHPREIFNLPKGWPLDQGGEGSNLYP